MGISTGNQIYDLGDSASHTMSALPRQFRPDLSKMTLEQWKCYVRAMSFHITKSALEVFQNLARTSTSTLVGIQLSGVLKSRNVIGIQPSFTASGYCQKNFSTTQSLDVANATQTLENTLNGILLVPLDKMTYFFASLWIAARISFPSIARRLLAKEEVWLQQIMQYQSLSPSREVQQPIARSVTIASKISFFIDLMLPAIFTGAQTALGIRVIEQLGSSFTLPGSEPVQWSLTEPGFNLSVMAQINQVMMNTLSAEEDLISTDVLVALLIVGTFMYILQAWLDFHDTFQSKKIDSAPAIVIAENPVDLLIPQSDQMPLQDSGLHPPTV